MKTLLQVNVVANWGSTGRIAEEIGQKAIDKGWNSYIAYGRNANCSESQLIKIGSIWDIKFHGLKSRLFDRHGLGSKRATLKFVERIKEIKPDIIHLHNIHGYYLNIEILFNYLSISNIPVVWTLHDCWPFTGHCAYYSIAKCDKWLNQCYNCVQKKSYPASLCIDRSAVNYALKKSLFTSLADMTIVPVSKWLGDQVQQSFLREHAIQVIHNGVDLTKFYPRNSIALRQKMELIGEHILLGVATSWSKRKGLADYLKLAEVLPVNCKIILVGLSKQQIKNLPKNIIGLTRTESIDELAELYSLADIVLNLSYEETFGLTTVEGFACGTPGIVYNCTASPELISPETGLIVEGGNLGQLAGAIDEILLKGTASFSIACRNRAELLYDKMNKFKEYIELYHDILNK